MNTIQNKKFGHKQFALIFRLVALIFAVIGLMKQIGVFSGNVGGSFFMYYTIQSNLLVIVLFIMLVIRTGKSLKINVQGSSASLTEEKLARFEMVCVVDILLTFIVFWALLVPQVSPEYIFSFENMAVHTVTPLLCLADYILFARKYPLKYRDVYFTCIFPLFYLIFTAVASLSGYIYNFGDFAGDAGAAPVRVPYFFLDYEKLGWMVLVFTGVILLFILLMGHVFYLINKKEKKHA